MNKKKYISIALFLVTCFSIHADTASGNVKPQETKKPAKPKQKGVIDLPGVKVNLIKKEVSFNAKVCLSGGILEYLICKPGTFDHESLFTATCQPSILHSGLLLLGLQPLKGYNPNIFSWDADSQKQSRLSVIVEWTDKGKTFRKPMSYFLKNRENKKGFTEDDWAFLGSGFYKRDGKRKYYADATGLYAGLWFNGSSVIQYTAKSKNPYKGEDHGFEVKDKFDLPLGQKVKIILSPYSKGKK